MDKDESKPIPATAPLSSSDVPDPVLGAVRSLLEHLASYPESGLVEHSPGVYMIRKDFTAEQLDKG